MQDVLAVCIPNFQEEPTILLVDSEDCQHVDARNIGNVLENGVI